MKPQSPRRRCVIYTRKSTDEGLDQNFNSLDAQREACGAYILGQTHEGWEPTGELYDDGALYQMLRNRIYRGEITHRDKSYPGEHEEIIDVETFDLVGERLTGNQVKQKHAAYAEHPSLFAGIIWDGDGRRLTPNHANKSGVRYRYYIGRKDKERHRELAYPPASTAGRRKLGGATS